MDSYHGDTIVTNSGLPLEVSPDRRHFSIVSSQELIPSLFKLSASKNSREVAICSFLEKIDLKEGLAKGSSHLATVGSFLCSISPFKIWKERRRFVFSNKFSPTEERDSFSSLVWVSDQDALQRHTPSNLQQFPSKVNVITDPKFVGGHFSLLPPIIHPNLRLIVGLNGLHTHCNDAFQRSDTERETRNSTSNVLHLYSLYFPKCIPRTVICNGSGETEDNSDKGETTSHIWFSLLLPKTDGESQKIPVFARLQGGPNAFLSEAVKSQSERISTAIKLPTLPISTASLTGLMARIPRSSEMQQGFIDREKLSSVQEFFHYTEMEGRKLFQELDRDGDGHATLSDIEEAIRRRKLPPFYASEIIKFGKKHTWLSKSFGWDEFSSLIKEKEPKMLSAFNSVSLCNCGTIHKKKLKALLQSASLPATERNVTAMLHFLNADKEDSVSYSQFRNFMLFVPTELIVNDPWTIWFEAATRRSTDMLLQTVPAVRKNRTLTRYTQDIWKIGPLVSRLSIASPLQKLSHLATQMWKMKLLTSVNHK